MSMKFLLNYVDTKKRFFSFYIISTQNSDCDPSTTVHVDSFLYSEEDIDRLCDEGKMSRCYCQDCGSHNTTPLSK